MKKECKKEINEIEFDVNDLRVERKNGMFLSNNQVKLLQKYHVNYNDYKDLSKLIFKLNELTEDDDELESLAMDIDEFNYYNNQNK